MPCPLPAPNPSGSDRKAGDNLDDTEFLRTFVEQLRRVIDVRPNMRNHIGEMDGGNVYDISEVLKILKESLKPVFRIDKQERKKRRKSEAAVKNEDAPDSPKGMSSVSDDAEEQWDGVGN